MKHGLNEAIANAIIKAQVASDGGKNIDDIKRILPYSNLVWKKGYSVKDEYIFQAIKLILQAGKRGKECGFRFYVAGSHIEYYDDWVNCYIVYFDFKIGVERYQVSFHSFNRGLEKYRHKSDSYYKTRWNKKRDGHRKSSRSSVQILKKWVFDM